MLQMYEYLLRNYVKIEKTWSSVLLNVGKNKLYSSFHKPLDDGNLIER